MKHQLAFEILEIKNGADALCREMNADLPEYFGIPEANEHYAMGVLMPVNFPAKQNNKLIGLLSTWSNRRRS